MGGKGEKVGVFEKWEHKGGHRNLPSHFHLTAIYSCSVGRCLFKGALEEQEGPSPPWRSHANNIPLAKGRRTGLAWKIGAVLAFFFFFFYPRIKVLNGVCFLVNTFVPLAWGGGSLLLGSGPKLKREERGKSAIISATTLPKFPFFTVGIGKGNQISKCSG